MDPVTDKAWALEEGSLSARRAWIEIEMGVPIPALPHVALRKESVDRNANAVNLTCKVSVALRKESVDRNLEAVAMVRWTLRRSPQGERG